MDDGFPKELDKEVIRGFGNAIVPQIACEIFKSLVLLYLEREGKKIINTVPIAHTTLWNAHLDGHFCTYIMLAGQRPQVRWGEL